MKQDVITDNAKIFQTLQEELSKAKSEIIVVAAWFTDPELIDILNKKISEGVDIKIVVSDNIENDKADFNFLLKNGASITRIKPNGSGMMHQKYCIIDNNIAIHGSYNWTVNARKKNQESVILTSHKKTIKKLKKAYIKLLKIDAEKDNVKTSLLDKLHKHILHKEPKKEDNKIDEKDREDKSKSSYITDDFKTILEGLIESEIFSTDKKQLRTEGFKRASLTKGDHQTLPNTLDTLYADLVNNLDIACDKKETIRGKIQTLKNRKLERLKLEQEQEVNILDSEIKANELQIDQEINKNEMSKSHEEIERGKLQRNKIAVLDSTKNNYENDIENLKVNFVKTKIKWFELTPAIIVGIFLLIYIFFFYSSAAYILIYSNQDIKVAQMQGITIAPAEVFDSEAINKAIDKGGAAPFFIFLFVIIPIGLAVIKTFLPNMNKIKGFLIWVAILLVDILLALVISKSIHQVDYLTGRVDDPWHLSNLFKDENFYLVFVMGALGVILFKVIWEKIHYAYSERNIDSYREKNKISIKQLKKKINKVEKDKNNCELKIADINKKIITLDCTNSTLHNKRNELPVTYEKKKKSITYLYNIKTTGIEEAVEIYLVKMDNNDLKFSVNALRDRVNTFIDGWVDYLYDTYSIHRAKQMSYDADVIKNKWFETKLNIENK